MVYLLSFAMILNGAICDAFSGFNWLEWYLISRDVQMMGFALLAFSICDYNKIEMKAAMFFLFVWRVFVTFINLFEFEVFYSPLVLAFLSAIYLTWIGKACKMGVISEAEERPGAYYFLMPIHSVWGLLKSVFIPWSMARYESVVAIDGGTLWAVNRGRFIKRQTKFTNIHVKVGAKVYLGRPFHRYEIEKLDAMVGKRCFPGIRDCRKLRIV